MIWKFIHKLFQKILSKEPQRKGAFFDSSNYEMENFLSGIGESILSRDAILIKNYPFEPSIAFPEKEFKYHEIDAICLDAAPNYFKVGNELIFVTAEMTDELRDFAERHRIKIFNQTWNWDRLLEPFIDTEFDEVSKRRTMTLLGENGISEKEVNSLRKEVGGQMLKYNFDTMLWDWNSLGLLDVLSAMRVKNTKKEFRDFYQRAMEIELRSTGL